MTIKTKFEIGEEVWFLGWKGDMLLNRAERKYEGKKEWISAKISCFQISKEEGKIKIYYRFEERIQKIEESEAFGKDEYIKAMKKDYRKQIQELKKKIKELEDE